MGGYDPDNYDDVSSYLNLDDSDEEDNAMTPTPTHEQYADQDVKSTLMPLSPPASATDDVIDPDDQDEDDLYAVPNDNLWKVRRASSVSASLDSPVNPQWLLSPDPPPQTDSQNSPPVSDDAKTPSDRRMTLDTIPERNEQSVKAGTTNKTSKSFPLMPNLLNMKSQDNEDEKILASEEGKKLNPKERRQLRNKVSARNFRVRRKEYIGHLEHLVESQSQEIENLRQTLSAVQLENTQLRQESGFLRSIALNHPPQQSPQAPQDSVMSVPHPNKDVNPNTFEWPLAYDGMQSPTQPNNKFADRPMFGGHIHAYGVRVPEVQFDKPHLNNPSNGLAPPLPPPPAGQYPPNSPRSSQEPPKTPPGLPPSVENLGYPGMLQAVSYLYDYIVKASGPMTQQPPPQQQHQQPVGNYPVQPNTYQPPPQPWAEAKAMGAPALGFNQYYNGNWGWGGGPPGPAI